MESKMRGHQFLSIRTISLTYVTKGLVLDNDDVGSNCHIPRSRVLWWERGTITGQAGVFMMACVG